MRGWRAPNVSTAAILLLSCTPWGSAAPRYTLTDLGHLPDGPNEVYPGGINALGQVTGISGAHFGANGYHAFLWNPNVPNGTTGSMIDLGYLPGGQNYSAGTGINASGQITGNGFAAGTDYLTGDRRAFLWTPTSPNGTTGFMLDLGARPEGFGYSTGQAINAFGQVIGYSNSTYLWTPSTPNGPYGSMVDLGSLPGGSAHNTFADSINDSGQVAGSSDAITGTRAYLWTPTTPNGTTGSMIDLGDLPGGLDFSQGFGINNRGQVTGYSNTAMGDRAFLWTPDGGGGTMIDLGVPEGKTFTRGIGINSVESVVGEAFDGDRFSAFLWTPQDGMLDLWSLADSSRFQWTFTKAIGINDAGQIIGYGVYDPDFFGSIPPVTHSFLLTPVPESAMMFPVITFSVLLYLRPIRNRMGA